MPKAATIPIIDISAEGADQAQVAKGLVDAAVDYGFVYVKNAGRDISVEQIQNAFDVSRTLFASPLEDKQRCKIEKNNQGWSGMHTETLDPKTQRIGDSKEGFNFGPFTSKGEATQPIPCSMEPHQAQLAAFRSSCHALCQKLLHLFGIGLGVTPADFFTAAHAADKPSGSILRFLYYPPPPPPSAANGSTSSSKDRGPETNAEAEGVRAGAHSDYGSVTLLFRLPGQAGLEILEPHSRLWTPVPVCPPGTVDDPSPPVLVNIGDLLSYWTNGLLRSTVHRVTSASRSITDGESTAEPRYSLVYFCHPADGTPLSAVPSERVRGFRGEGGSEEHGGTERTVMTADEHLQMRLQATYLQLYEDKREDGKKAN